VVEVYSALAAADALSCMNHNPAVEKVVVDTLNMAACIANYSWRLEI
jgi:hypothetical protein